MRPEPLETVEQRRILDEFRAASRELDDVIEHTTRLLGQLSRNVAFVVAPQRDAQTFRHIQLIWLSERTGLAIVVTSLGLAVQKPFEHGAHVEADDLTRLSNRLNAAFTGKTMREITTSGVARVVAEAELPSELAQALAGALGDVSPQDDARPSSRAVRSICSISPSFKICVNCARFCVLSKSRKRCTTSSPTRSATPARASRSGTSSARTR